MSTGTLTAPAGPRDGEPGPARPLGTRLLVAAVLTAAVVAHSAVPALRFPLSAWVALGIAAVVVCWAGLPIHRAAWRALHRRDVTGDVLVPAAALGALAWSTAALLGGAPFHPEVAAGVTVLGLATRLTVVLTDRGDTAREATGHAWIGAAGIGAAGIGAAGIGAAVATAGYWLGSGAGRQTAVAAAVAVLVACCAAALGAAGRTALLAAIRRATRLGLPVRSPAALARSARVDTVVLGTSAVVAPEALEVHAVHVVPGVGVVEVLRLAGAVGGRAGDAVVRAVAGAAATGTGPLPDAAEFEELDGLGVRGIVAEVVPGECGDRVVAHAVLAGRPALLAEHGIALPADLDAARSGAEATGRTAVAVAWDGVPRGLVVVGAAVRPAAADAVRRLRRMGLTPMLLTGDGCAAALGAAGQIGIGPEALAPGDGGVAVARVRGEGRVVAVLGDGAEDAAALAAADVAVADGDLLGAVEALRLARRAAAVSRCNRFLAVLTSAAALPLAAAGVLDPVLAVAAVAAATVTAAAAAVLAHGVRLRRIRFTSG